MSKVNTPKVPDDFWLIITVVIGAVLAIVFTAASFYLRQV